MFVGGVCQFELMIVVEELGMSLGWRGFGGILVVWLCIVVEVSWERVGTILAVEGSRLQHVLTATVCNGKASIETSSGSTPSSPNLQHHLNLNNPDLQPPISHLRTTPSPVLPNTLACPFTTTSRRIPFSLSSLAGSADSAVQPPCLIESILNKRPTRYALVTPCK